MLQSGSFDERFDSSDIDDASWPDDDEEEEEDHYLKGPDVLNPRICPKCKKHLLEARKYQTTDAKNNVWYCENCHYICIRCGELISTPSKRSRKAVITCSDVHCPYL